MINRLISYFYCLLAFFITGVVDGQDTGATNALRPAPVKIIFDTDLGPDSDDAGAIAMLLALERLGEAEISAMMASTTNPWCAPCIEAINTWYGRSDIPVGTLKGEGYSGGSEEWPGNAFNGYIAGKYPNRLKHGEYVPDALNLYRDVLSEQANNSVTIVVTGPLTNLAHLLLSAADSRTGMNGDILVEKKVRQVVVMGGKYPSGAESNFMADPAATATVLSGCPRPLVFSGFEIGEEILTGQRLYLETDADNPVRLAYHLWDLCFARRFEPGFDPENGIWPHSSYDQTAVLYAVRGLRDYWDMQTSGQNVVDENGANTWLAAPDKPHAYLIEKMPRQELAKIIEDLMILPRE